VSGKVRQRIIDLIADRPHGISRSELLSLVYEHDPNGGPQTANTISTLIARANKEIASQGYQITPAWPGHGGRYRLVKTSTAPSRSAMTTIDEIFRGYRAAEQRILAARRGGIIAPDDVIPANGLGGPESCPVKR
jgi:hypothetical protein